MRSFAYSFALLARSRSRSLSSLRSQPPLLPRYLVQLFRRLKGPRYADTLFVTRESRRGCLRQASKQADATPSLARHFPLGQEIANVAAHLPYLDFSTAIFPFSPSASGVSFTCLPSRRVEERADRFQVASRTLLDGAATRRDARGAG